MNLKKMSGTRFFLILACPVKPYSIHCPGGIRFVPQCTKVRSP
jgi:hypothetical protein